MIEVIKSSEKRENGRRRFFNIAFDLATSRSYPEVAAALRSLRRLRKDTSDMIVKIEAADMSADCVNSYIVPIAELDDIIGTINRVQWHKKEGWLLRGGDGGPSHSCLLVAQRKAKSIVKAWI